MTIELALFDAARNCEQYRAVAKITLRSGAVIEGKLKRPVGDGTVHFPESGSGWATALVEEIAAVETRRG